MIMQTQEAISMVNRQAEALFLPETRFVDAMNLSEYARQGDIYLAKIDALPPGCKLIQNRQLAPGTTQGSRHIAGEITKVYSHPQQGEIEQVTAVIDGKTIAGGRAIGPVIVQEEFDVTEHPQHAHVSLPPGIYQVYGQIDPNTLRRVQD